MRRVLQAWNCDGCYRPGIVRRMLQAMHCEKGVTGLAL